MVPRDLRDWESLFSNNHLWVDQTTQEDVARHYHGLGVAETVHPETARHCLCHAARLGHPESQFYLAGSLAQDPALASGVPPLALAGFETAASNSIPTPIPEMTQFETGLVRRTDPAADPPAIPADLIAAACGTPAVETTPPD